MYSRIVRIGSMRCRWVLFRLMGVCLRSPHLYRVSRSFKTESRVFRHIAGKVRLDAVRGILITV